MMEGHYAQSERERLEAENRRLLATVDALTERAERAEGEVERLNHGIDAAYSTASDMRQERDEALALADARGRALERIANSTSCEYWHGYSPTCHSCRAREALALPAPEALRQQQEREEGMDVLIEALRRALENERDFLNECASDAEDDKLFGFSDAAKAITEALEATPHETQATITQWAKATFGEPADLLQIWKRVNDEMKELYEALLTNQPPDKIAKECADVHIVLCQIPERLGLDLGEAVDAKMKVNRARKWRTNGDGTRQHIEEGTV